MWQKNARKNVLNAIFKSSVLYSRTSSCFETQYESSTTGTIASKYYSQVNLIGDASFEDNHANSSGGKLNFEDSITPMQGE